jgi:drug/metabolite transporter (DMT)-like permease
VLLTGVFLAGYVSSWMAALQRAPASAVTAVLVLAAVITTLLQALANGTLPALTAVIGAVVLALGVVTVGIVTARRPEVASGQGAVRSGA